MLQKTRRRAPKPKTVQPVISLHKEDQAVKEEQSYAMVKGLLQVLVASIAYQRDLFPKSCFDTRSPSSIRTKAHDSSDDEVALLATALAQRHQPLMVLTSKKEKKIGVDTLLAWLDEIFKGLLDRSLDGVQFSIYADKSKPSEVLELYTFSFQYRNGKDGQRRLTGLTTPGSGSGMITTESLRSDMVNVVDGLNNYQQQLPVLPRERYLMCHLFHSPNAPRHHRTAGFHTCTDTNMAVIENGLWSMKQRSFGSIDSGIHRMGLEIGFMTPTDAAKDLDRRSMPAHDMEYTRTVRRTLKPNLGRGFDGPVALQGAFHTTNRLQRGFTQADEQGDSIRLGLLQGVTEETGRSKEAARQTVSRRPLSNDSGEIITVSMKPDVFGEAVPDRPHVSYIHDTLSADSHLQTQIVEAQDSPVLPTWNWKLQFGKALEMNVKKGRLQVFPDGDDRVVRCECSCDWEDLLMLRCNCCQKLQHYYCYGFAVETRVLEHHCYQCLLEDTHGSLLKDMRRLAIFRRALWILYEKTPSSPAKLAQELHFDMKTTQGLIRLLDEGDYLASGRIRISPVTTTGQRSSRDQLYREPLTSIGTFYETREDSSPANTDIEDGSARRKRIKI